MVAQFSLVAQMSRNTGAFRNICEQKVKGRRMDALEKLREISKLHLITLSSGAQFEQYTTFSEVAKII